MRNPPHIAVRHALGTAFALVAITLLPMAALGTPQSTAPEVTLSPTSLTFAEQLVGTTSAVQTVSLSNTGTASLSITSISATGTDGGDFTETNTCGTSVVAGASCTISVTFKPHGENSRTGTLSIADNASGSPQSVTLSGTGTYIELVPASLTFTSQLIGTTSPAQTLTLTNTLPSATINISGVTITGAAAGDFAETNTCGTSVAAGASCTVSVTFTPSVAGTLTANVSVSDDGGGGTQTASLTGTSVTGPAAALAPGTLTFSGQIVGTPSAPQTVTLTNTGGSALSITSVIISGTNPGDFAQTNTCGTSVAAGLSCTISVTFTPVAAGTRVASLSVFDDAPNTPQTVVLTGITAPAAALGPATIAFGSQPVGSISAPQTATLTNTGGSALTITTISTSGPFPMTSTCGASLAVGSSCTMSVTFAPTATGSATGTLTVSDNAPGGAQTVALSGTGTISPVASLSPASLSFPATSIGSTSAGETVTLTNTGNSTLTLTSIALTGTNSGDFTYTSGCGSGALQPGASCALTVFFKPAAAGIRSASVMFTNNAAGSPQTVALSGTGIANPTASLSPASLTFSSQSVGSASPLQTVTLTNTGSATLTISSISTTSSSFVQSPASAGGCASGTSLVVGTSCKITTYFKPVVTGNITGSLTIADNAPGSPQSVALTGTGIAAGVGFSPPTGLVFKSEAINTPSAPQSLILTNTGSTEALSISSIVVTGNDASDFTQTSNCPMSPSATLAAGATCAISVVFNPSTGGNLSAALTVTDNAPGSPHSVPLSGAGATFAMTAPTSTASVTAGQSAAYGLNFAPTGGFSGLVTLSCTTTAPAASCSVKPPQLNLSAPNAANATATVTTTAGGTGLPTRHLPPAPGPWALWVLGAMIAVGFGLVGAARQRTRWILAGALALSLVWVACGGGGSPAPSAPASTPAGTYQVTVTASSPTLSQNVSLTLTVQ